LRSAADENIEAAAVAEPVSVDGFAVADSRSTLSEGAGAALSVSDALAVLICADWPTDFQPEPKTAATPTTIMIKPINTILRDVIR
jgi:hypothetical protein